MGDACRYDGAAKPCDAVARLCSRADAFGICPEVDGGLPTPRPPAELVSGHVMSLIGDDVTSAYERGATMALRVARDHSAKLAVLKGRSPSCGVGHIYDGNFSGHVIEGDGVTAALMKREGICVVSEDIVKSCEASVQHPVAIVLGSGWGELAKDVKPVRRIDYLDIDGFPTDAVPVEGHSYVATVGSIDGVPVVIYPGRVHLYQGYSAFEVTSLVRHAARIGCRDIIFACSTGAIPSMAEKGLGIISDHINLTGTNPLVEEGELRGIETQFVGMTDAYTPYLREIAKGVAADEGITVGEGVYAGLLGPSYETEAEVAALGKLGVSYVGMSTVCEVIMAHALGMNVLGLTLATNYAGAHKINHEEVLAEGKAHTGDFSKLVHGVLRMLSEK